MTAVSEVESLRNLLREQGLGSALPLPADKSHPPAPTGFTTLDALLGGGIPRGQITELVGQGSSGRTSVTFAVVAEATVRGEVAAYIDATDSLDPRSAQRAGIALDRLLWVRCGVATGAFASPSPRNGDAGGLAHEGGSRAQSTQRAGALHGRHSAAADRRERLSLPVRFSKKNDPAWQAVNLIASAGGFGVIVLDLGGVTKRKLREWQSRQWLRLRRAIEHSPTALVILASEHLASSVSALVLEIAREKTRWEGTPNVSLWLSGISAKVRVAHQRKSAHRDAEPERTCSLGIGEQAMPEEMFQVDQIDHVELFVPDRYEAASWYERVLGLKVVPEYEHWAQPDGGPLMISTPRNGTKLALFSGKPRGSRETAGFHRVAFRVDGQGFLRFLDRLQEVAVFDEQGKQLTADAVVDHGRAFSIYFHDPYGHRLEITTYEPETVLKERKGK